MNTKSGLNFVEPTQLKHEFIDSGHAELDSYWFSNFLDLSDSILSARMWLEGSKSENLEMFRHSLMSTINHIDELLQNQLNEIIHHPTFQKLERTWIGTQYLCEQIDKQSVDTVKIKVMTATWEEISKDSLKAIEFDQSALFKLIYQNEYSMPGGEPFGVVIGDYELGNNASKLDKDISVVRKISQSAAAAFSPFIFSASPEIFGVDRFCDLSSIKEFSSQFDQIEYLKWRELRNSDDSKFIGMTAPNVLFRLPYQSDGSRGEHFVFEERVKLSDKELLWGSGAYCFAAVAIRAYQEHGWFTHIRGVKQGDYSQGLVVAPARSKLKLDAKNYRERCPLNLKLSEKKEQALSDCGFIPISPVAETDMVGLMSNVSIYQSTKYQDKTVEVNDKLTSMLQYTLCVSRIAHYIKVMGRDKVGSYQDASAIERDFQKWLHQYTTASDEASDELRAKYPLNEAQIRVREKRDSPGHYYSTVHLRPHFQLDQMVSSIKLITELSPEHSA